MKIYDLLQLAKEYYDDIKDVDEDLMQHCLQVLTEHSEMLLDYFSIGINQVSI